MARKKTPFYKAPGFWILFISITLVSGLFVQAYKNTIEDPDVAQFAQCLFDRGMVMYGVDSCPACQQQKGFFGAAFSRVEYIECTRDPSACQSANIRAYPSWVFEGESREGTLTLGQLADWSGCSLIAGSPDADIVASTSTE